jgi:DNA-binding SARP family transcriptional activator
MPAARGSRGTGITFGILGPLAVFRDGTEISVAGARQLALLAYLLLHANRVVPSERLIDELFGDEPPEGALNSVHTGISRLRRQLAGTQRQEVPILTRPPGYLLELERGQLDLHVFEDLLQAARRQLDAGDAKEASEVLRSALELWRGEPLADLTAYAFARAEAARLEDLRLAAVMERIESDLALGRHTEVVGEVERLIADHPLQERLRGQLMLALYRSGRQSEALELYQDTRRHLVTELGLEPGPSLRELERAILAHDPELDAPRAASRSMRRTGTTSLLALAALAVLGVLAAGLLLRDGGSSLDALTPNSVGAIDPPRGEIVAEVPVGGAPGPLVAGAGALWTLTDDGRLLVRIDPEERRATTYGLEAPAIDLAVDADSVWLLQPASGHGQVSRFNPRVETVVDEPLSTRNDFSLEDHLVVGRLGMWLAHSKGTQGPGHDVLLRVDASPGKGPSEVEIGQAVALAMDANAIWVLHSRSEVDRVDGRSGEREGVITLGLGWAPQSIAIGLGAIWVSAASVENCPASFGPGTSCPTGKPGAVFRIDPVANAIAAKIPVASGPAGMTIAEGSLWLADCCKHVLQRLDPVTNRLSKRIAIGTNAGAVAVSDGLVWVGATG